MHVIRHREGSLLQETPAPGVSTSFTEPPPPILGFSKKPSWYMESAPPPFLGFSALGFFTLGFSLWVFPRASRRSWGYLEL